ncbi:SDR family NAD(P)-dependent oxidoreductase [Amycolatopsis sp. NPDC051903]|uniref:SDR family NAD(P)-dependent oxidoreductase n=1 Tax=Amycolatopsis sp. NPDC051903 TaxID=3363936 RepID=UPI0037A99FFC
MPGVVVIGAGPGIGRAVAQRFARGGLEVALVARTHRELGVAATTHLADVGDEHALRGALDGVAGELGLPEAVVYNAAVIRPDTPGELSVDEHLALWRVNVLGAYVAAAHLAPAMAERGRGTFLVTGGMPEPKAAYSSLSLGKAALRTLVALFAEQYPALHFATVTVAGAVAPGTAFDPDDIAEHYWRLHTQRGPGWDLEVVHDQPQSWVKHPAR